MRLNNLKTTAPPRNHRATPLNATGSLFALRQCSVSAGNVTEQCVRAQDSPRRRQQSLPSAHAEVTRRRATRGEHVRGSGSTYLTLETPDSRGDRRRSKRHSFISSEPSGCAESRVPLPALTERIKEPRNTAAPPAVTVNTPLPGSRHNPAGFSFSLSLSPSLSLSLPPMKPSYKEPIFYYGRGQSWARRCSAWDERQPGITEPR